VATTLLRNGRVHGSAATALVVDGTAIAWIGGSDAPSADHTTDLEGAWLAPAFVDAHVHTTATGLALTGLDLTDCPSLAVALQRVADHSRRLRGGVVLGTGWDETGWPEQRPPTAAELDRASHGGVVYLARTDVHSAVASSALLAASPDVRGLDGFMGEGLVRQDAHHAVRRTALESVTAAQRREAQHHALERMARLGIASVHECGGPDISGEADFTALLALDHPVERIGYWGELDAVDKARELGARGAAGDLFVDGALGSHTACLEQPYLDGGQGHRYLDVAQITRHVRACTEAGVQAGFHAIGDAAMASVTEAFAAVAEELGLDSVRAARHRVEHAEMVSPEQIAVLARCGVVASVQPAFDDQWGGPDGMYVGRLGLERAQRMNPFGAMAFAGLALAFGSDSPVTAPDPWRGVRAAVRHRTAGSGVSPATAFAAHTAGGRHAARQEPGALRVGGPATLAAWDGAVLDEQGIPELDGALPTCRLTLVEGRQAFAR
jgi:predicted amidohydrolase YtcJ